MVLSRIDSIEYMECEGKEEVMGRRKGGSTYGDTLKNVGKGRSVRVVTMGLKGRMFPTNSETRLVNQGPN